jgi:hypothetical protein
LGATVSRKQTWVSEMAKGAKDKGVAILDYALGNRPSTGLGEVGDSNG